MKPNYSFCFARLQSALMHNEPAKGGDYKWKTEESC